ncbi:hypothetical protein AWB79_01575 [Caballeronia hypogeia]|uniref:Lipoprotein n=1 Tax=Caballeronia hypogeia TaxID=1777140 RepID=A0A157ZXZ2_9BURK|nr:hypothetical protein [Caballeronia hypogeia]SAK50353.1 hypothetical protein AWB79_01575 [Caballeronia hypogeia]
MIAHRIVRLVLPMTLASLGTLAHAEAIKSIDAPLDCRSSAHDFIAPLQENHLLETKPMRIEPNHVNAFKPTHGTTLTAYGFKVYVVVGYQKDDPIFKPGKGQPIADSAYGVVVIGSDDAVQEKVSAAGSDADVHHVAPFITAIFCKQ